MRQLSLFEQPQEKRMAKLWAVNRWFIACMTEAIAAQAEPEVLFRLAKARNKCVAKWRQLRKLYDL